MQLVVMQPVALGYDAVSCNEPVALGYDAVSCNATVALGYDAVSCNVEVLPQLEDDGGVGRPDPGQREAAVQVATQFSLG